MLRRISTSGSRRRGGRFAIIASKYNAEYVDALVRAAQAELDTAQAACEIVRVPGAFEIPVVAATLLGRRRPRFDALICLGVVIRGQTAHADLITRAVTDSLVRLQVEYRRPVIHEVLLVENEAQAHARCLDPERSRGREAALTALEMAEVMETLTLKNR